ncbi:hypothetical protein [Microbispora sp. KK1-11]|uniref:hypothetical protein n=1 Tax=Microbispora sp. KK1-11 TaxID=2053005 RepID=UPI00115B7F28|nr:hypothetical protein [Microbispora sp. KK1-11]TQS30025.1 hypothetical protein FLW16_06595 [Microbispora sp. KK1-11]
MTDTETREEFRDRLFDALPDQMTIWADDAELEQFADWDLGKWMHALGHHRVHTACCDRCGCAVTCTGGAFYDAVVSSVLRELDRMGALREPFPPASTTEETDPHA